MTNNQAKKVYPSNNRSLVYFTISFWIIALGLILFLTIRYSETSLAFGFITSLILCLLPFVFWKRDPRLVSPIYYTLVYLIIAYHIKFIAVRMQINYVNEDYVGLLWRDELVSKVFWGLTLGILGLYLGYYLTPKILLNLVKTPRLNFKAGLDRNWPWKSLIILIIGLSSLGIQLFTGAWSSFAGVGQNWDPRLNQLFSYTYDYVWIAVIASLLWLFASKQKNVVGILICFFIIAISIGLMLFFLGSKTWIISTMIWVLMCLFISKRKISAGFLIFGIVIVSLFAFTFVPAFRSNYLEKYQYETGNISEYYQTGLVTLNELTENPIKISESAGTLISRFGGVDNAAFVMNFFPRYYAYRYFKDLLVIPFAAIPRVILPIKPTSDLITWYSQEVVGGRSAAAAHPVGEGYLEWSWAGVLILFWGWGLIQSLWYRGFYLPRENSPVASVLYMFFILGAIGFGEWIIGYILKFPGRFIVILPLIYILNYQVGKRK